jgi:tRNA dimethylallyltransferase
VVAADLRRGLGPGAQAAEVTALSNSNAVTAWPHRALGLCLAGPTGAGKTAVALALAQQLPIEIISVDSALVFCSMDIGTAKPSAAELASVPHHLINILAPTQSYSAAQFVADVKRLVPQIHARGRWPVLVGGTMLYFKALREGLDTLPGADAEVRAAIESEAAALGWPALHAQLAQVDAATAARLPPNDAQRIQRALEVWRVSGRPLSAWHTGAQQHAAAAAAAAQDWPMVSLEPASRAWLHARVAERFDTMLAAGLLDEVRGLQARGDLHAQLPAMRCVGYRQAWATLAGDVAPSLLRDSAIAATRQLVKRQLTWLRSMPDRQLVACDAPGALSNAVQALLNLAAR